MNPISLKIKGINSFSEEQVIDFEALTKYGFFGIFGPTGSGKTTIIDAISIALYDKIPRMEKERSIKQAFNINCGEIYISFSFSIGGVKETVYTVERAYKKVSSGHKPTLARLYTNGEPPKVLAEKTDETTKKINEIIGLAYDDFVRSVILPQGQFSEFLFLANKERRAMLERIFRLEKYGDKLSRQVRQKFNDCKNEISIIDSKLEIIGETSAEKIKAEKESLESLNKSLLLNKEVLRAKQEDYELLKKLCEAGIQHKKYVKEREKLLSSKEQMEYTEKRLKKHEMAEKAVPLITQQKEVKQRLVQLSKSKSVLEKEYLLLNKKYEEIKESYSLAVKDKEEKYPELLQMQTKLNEALKLDETIKDVEKQRTQLLTEHTKCKKTLESLNKKSMELENDISITSAELTKIAERKQQIYTDPQLRQKIEEGLETEKRAVEIKKEINRLAKRSTKYKSEYEKAFEEEKKLSLETDRLEKEINAAKKQEEMCLASRLAALLEEGKPCPVCGSENHPTVAGQVTQNASINILALEAALKKLTIQRASLSGSITSEKKAASENEEALKVIAADYEALTSKLEEYKTETNTQNFVDSLTKIRENEKEADFLGKNEISLRKSQEKKQKLYDEVKIKLNEINSQISIILVSGTEKKEMIQKLRQQAQRFTGDKDPKEELVLVNERLNKMLQAENALKEAFSGTEAKKQKIYENLLEKKNLEEANNGLLSELDEKLLSLLPTLGFESADEAMDSLVKDKERLKVELDEYNDRLKNVSINMARLEEILEGNENAEQRAGIRKNEIALLESRVQEETKQTAIIGERIIKMQENLEKAVELAAKRKNLEHSLDILDDLAKLFAGNHFVEYVAKRQLRQIATETSMRLSRMTGGRYSLELDETDFVIQDNFNDGVRRSPKTLSGGEIFLVSLCLALALSTRVQLTQSAPLQLFFLDEGFGTLDAGLLDIVMDTLEKLRLEKLNVGVITHVEELKNRIPAKLIVSPAVQGVRGTRVSTVIG